jgi:hypothetical protein
MKYKIKGKYKGKIKAIISGDENNTHLYINYELVLSMYDKTNTPQRELLRNVFAKRIVEYFKKKEEENATNN